MALATTHTFALLLDATRTPLTNRDNLPMLWVRKLGRLKMAVRPPRGGWRGAGA
jgi:hypothetical protein